MSKPCAYCGLERPATREHLWPDWLLQRTDYHRAYSERAGKIVGRNQTIRDVCAPCNNGPLSKLDAYAQTLYDQYIQYWVWPGQAVDFRYDHGQLLRWLMKISFNMTRTTGRHSQAFQPYRDVMLSPWPCTPIFAFGFVATVAPAYVGESGPALLRPMLPKGARAGPIIIPELADDRRFLARMVLINSYFFTLFLIEDWTMDAEEAWRIARRLPGTPLRPAGVTRIPPPRINTLQAFKGIESWPK